MQQELGRKLDLQEVSRVLKNKLAQLFEFELTDWK
jgi:hypothetical protein